MNDVSGSIRRKVATAVAAVSLAGTVVACSDEPEPAPAPAPTPETTENAAPEKTPESASKSETEEASETKDETEPSTSETETTTEEEKLGEGVAEAKDIFAPVMPQDLWIEFESCSSTGLQDSYECTGREVGQFQLFESRSKAASTTQLLTELRSSRVVRDTGRFVIGWSTLGTTAVITIVDNDEGLVAQQLVSSDQVEPDEKIAELGLDEPAGVADDPRATDTEWETYKKDLGDEDTSTSEEPREPETSTTEKTDENRR